MSFAEFHLFQRKKIIILVLIILVLTMLVEIWSLNRLSTFGDQISKLEGAKQTLTLQNQLLKNEIDKRAALSQMEKYAQIYGFKPLKTVKYITGQ